MANWATLDVGFWWEVFLKDQDNDPFRVSTKAGELQGNHQTPKRSKTRNRPSAQRAKAGALPKLSRQSDLAFQVDGQLQTLSPKEYRLVELIAAGYTNVDMAHLFCLSRSAIHRRTMRVMNKLGVSNRLELVLFALSHGIISPPPQDPV